MSDFEQPPKRAADEPTLSQPVSGASSTLSAEPLRHDVHSGTLARHTGTTSFPRIQHTRIRRSSAPVIRRQIDDATWNRRVKPMLRQGRTVTVRSGTATESLYADGKRVMMQAADGTVTKMDAAGIALLRTTHDFVADDLPAHLTDDLTEDVTESPGDGFKVSEYAGEPLSLVHHTASNDGSGAHLTVENAHAIALYDATSPNRGDVQSKVGQDKRTINDRLGKDYSIPAIDNMNFFPREKAKGKGKGKKQGASQALHEAMPLSNYLQFIVRAFDQCGVPREYGERMVHMAEAMAAEKALDLTTVFMRVGMDESSFIRAVLAIDARLGESGSGPLPLAAADRDPFARWWTTKGNEDGVPYLHDLSLAGTTDPAAPPALAARPWVREGTEAPSNTSYSSLETAYTKAHAPAFITAVNAWTALQPAPL